MSKKILLLLSAALILLSGNPINGSAETGYSSSENADLSTLQFKRIAVMPFLVGKLESPEKPVEKPLSQPCLLYTSPSPRDRQRSRMPSSA